MLVFNKKPFIIADISIAYYEFAKQEKIPDIEAAKFLIDEAQSCGVDAVMFQSFKAENILSRDSFALEELGLSMDYFDSLKNFDKFGVGEFKQLAEYCHSIGMIFLSTPLDFESVDYLDEFLDVYQIASSDVNNIPFIKYVASKNKPILLSTGAATLMEIKNAIKAIEDVSTVDVVIMHSILSFPTSYEDANLLMIKDLMENFPEYEIGYSDHTKPDKDMLVLTTAYNFGANVLEKHFTFDKKLNSIDSCYAMDADDVIQFKKNILFLSKISGRKNKQPLICESYARKEYRKSVVAKRDIKKGDVITEADIAFKRPGIGIPPIDAGEVIGRVADRKIPKDTLITFEMIN